MGTRKRRPDQSARGHGYVLAGGDGCQRGLFDHKKCTASLMWLCIWLDACSSPSLGQRTSESIRVGGECPGEGASQGGGPPSFHVLEELLEYHTRTIMD